ncbi:Histidinol-phosphate aminotransferase 2 [Abeliophyllum distichum]|uniref:histidinol-phosphate transaminase n=1 Tax=Abeliophyllum distichum TaxID=126358 RepID=A0ABD1U3B2_9LAMI
MASSKVPVKGENQHHFGCCCSVPGDGFIRPHLRKLSPNQTTLPFEVLSKRLGRKPEDIVKLDANENPYGPPPETRHKLHKVFEALGSMKFPHIYPDPECRRLRAALAEDSSIGAEYILVGCGADELVDLNMRCVLDPGEKIVDCPPTFATYEFDAAVNAALVIKVSRKSTSAWMWKRLLRMIWVKKYESLIVVRTFSKRAGLAGLQVGYGAFPLSIIEYIWRAKQPYNVSAAAEISACAG